MPVDMQNDGQEIKKGQEHSRDQFPISKSEESKVLSPVSELQVLDWTGKEGSL